MLLNKRFDVTFNIPVRIDSIERLENLRLIVDYLQRNFQAKIVVLEADSYEKAVGLHEVEKIFVHDYNPIFYRTRYLNQMTSICTSSYIAVWDCDVLVEATQITEALKLLETGAVEFVFPFDGHFYATPQLLKRIYQESNDGLNVFHQHKSLFALWHGTHSVGGAFIVNRQAYLNVGMENENFYGWGPEDNERVKRWEILGHRLGRINGPLYHLHHPRGLNSCFGSYQAELQNRNEYLKVCSMTRNELRNYVDSWPWRTEDCSISS